MADEPNGRFQWLKDELKDMERRITSRIDGLEQTTVHRLNEHSSHLDRLQSAQDKESGAKDQAARAERYRRWLITTGVALVGSLGALVGLVIGR